MSANLHFNFFFLWGVAFCKIKITFFIKTVQIAFCRILQGSSGNIYRRDMSVGKRHNQYWSRPLLANNNYCLSIKIVWLTSGRAWCETIMYNHVARLNFIFIGEHGAMESQSVKHKIRKRTRATCKRITRNVDIVGRNFDLANSKFQLQSSNRPYP